MRTKKPLFMEVSEKIKEDIARGIYSVILPAEAELTKIYSASRMTIRSALQKLNAENVIRTMYGKGSYVNPQTSSIPLPINTGKDYHDLLAGTSDRVELQELGYEELSSFSSPHNLPPEFANSPMLLIKRLSLREGQPKIYMEEYFSAKTVRRDSLDDLPIPIFQLISQVTGQRKEYTLSRFLPVLPPPHVCTILDLDPQIPIIVVVEEHYNSINQCAAFSLVYFSSDVDMQIGLVRNE